MILTKEVGSLVPVPTPCNVFGQGKLVDKNLHSSGLKSGKCIFVQRKELTQGHSDFFQGTPGSYYIVPTHEVLSSVWETQGP